MRPLHRFHSGCICALQEDEQKPSEIVSLPSAIACFDQVEHSSMTGKTWLEAQLTLPAIAPELRQCALVAQSESAQSTSPSLSLSRPSRHSRPVSVSLEVGWRVRMHSLVKVSRFSWPTSDRHSRVIGM